MKTNKLITALFACTFIVSANAAPKAQWVNEVSNNKASSLFSGEILTPQVNNNHQTVSFSYKLDANENLDFATKPFVEHSKQYWLDSTGTQLASGIELPVTGGTTIIRISPLSNDKSVQLTAAAITILNNGEEKNIDVFADSEELKATGAMFSDNSIALKVQTQAGKLNLKVATATGDMPFVVHVFEPQSPYVLSLNAKESTFNANQDIQITTTLQQGETKIAANLQGYINRPDGTVLGELKFSQQADGSFQASLPAVGTQGLAQGLWQVHVFAKGHDQNTEIMRDAQTSFAVNLNSAEFTNKLTLANNKLKIGVNVGVAGRYEVRGVIMGSNKTGQLQPIAMTMAASWLAEGQQDISLPITAKLMAQSNLNAPYFIKNITLTNQTYLAPVQKINSGIKLVNFQFNENIDK